MRRALILAALLVAPAARAQDWDVGPARPTRPARPNRPARPARPAAPARPATPPTAETPTRPAPAADTDRRARAIAHLLEALLRNAADAPAMLPTLARMVRERDGNLDALLADLRTRADATPPSAAASLLLGELLRQEGRVDEALTRLDTAARLDPRDPAARRALGELHRQLDHAELAATNLSAALDLTRERSAQADILRALVALAVARGDVATARAQHTRLVALFAGAATVRRELADALMSARLFREAVTEFEGLARALAGDNRVLPAALRDLGRAQLRAGDAAAAATTLRRALRIVGGDAAVRRELYDELTELYTQRNDLEGWITELQQREPPSHERWMLLGRLLAARGRTDDAVEATRRAIALRPNDIDGHIALIQLLTQAARLDELVAARRRLVAAAPRSPQYVIDLADDLNRAGHRAEALQALAQASARAGGDAEVHERLAQAYARLGEARLAVRETELMAREAPDDPDALEALGERYLEQGDEARAMTTWARIREGARDRARGLAALGAVYARHDRLNEALGAYRDALALRPDEVDWHKEIAVVQERARLLDGAVASWRRVLELGRGQRELQREARARIVNLWHVQGRLATMIAPLERAFRAEPPDLEAGRDLAEALARLRRNDEAEAVLRDLAARDPDDVPTLVTLERVRAQRGDLAGAMEALRQLVRVDARNAREWYQRLAAHALSLHRDEEALDAAAHAVQLNPDDASGHLRIGELYRARGNTASAVASLRRALALNDRLFPTYFQLADLHLGRDEPREAVDLYRRVVRLAQDDDLVGRAGRTAVQIALATHLHEELERDLLAASAASPSRAVFRRLLVDLYRGLAGPHVNALRFGAPEEAARARASLAQFGARALKPLLDTVAERESPQRDVALELLGFLGNPGAAPALLAIAEREDGPMPLRREALRAAAALADTRAVPRLVALVATPDTAMAGWALSALARIPGPPALAAVLRALGDTRRPEQQALAATLLAGRREPAVRAALRAVATGPGGELLRAAALVSLARSGDVWALAHARVATAFGPTMTAAALALAPLAERDPARCAGVVAPFLFAEAHGGSSGAVSLAHVAASALSACAGHPTASETPPDRGWSAAARFVGSLGVAPAPEDAVAALGRFRATVATAAAAAAATPEGRHRIVQMLADPGALPPLVTRAPPEALAAPRAEMLRAIAPSLAAAYPTLDVAARRGTLRLLADGGEAARRTAWTLLLAERDAGVIEDALDALPDAGPAGEAFAPAEARPWSLRLAAVRALARSGAADGEVILARALRGDPHAWVREAAAAGLRTRNTPAAVDALRGALDDPDPAVRDAARARSAP
ncbi:MAG: tetratricopeptide repeat protein [Polyangiales bacterium]